MNLLAGLSERATKGRSAFCSVASFGDKGFSRFGAGSDSTEAAFAWVGGGSQTSIDDPALDSADQRLAYATKRPRIPTTSSTVARSIRRFPRPRHRHQIGKIRTPSTMYLRHSRLG